MLLENLRQIETSQQSERNAITQIEREAGGSEMEIHSIVTSVLLLPESLQSRESMHRQT